MMRSHGKWQRIKVEERRLAIMKGLQVVRVGAAVPFELWSLSGFLFLSFVGFCLGLAFRVAKSMMFDDARLWIKIGSAQMRFVINEAF